MVDVSTMTQQPWPPAPKPKHTARTAILAAAGGLVLFILVGVAISLGGQAKPSTHTVVYRVTGTSEGAYLITYSTSGAASMEQFSHAAFPWSKSYTFKGYAVYQVMAQNFPNDPGTITCSIEVDGKVVQTATGDGPATIAHCVFASSDL